jgi:hypothetical protein
VIVIVARFVLLLKRRFIVVIDIVVARLFLGARTLAADGEVPRLAVRPLGEPAEQLVDAHLRRTRQVGDTQATRAKAKAHLRERRT